MAGITVQNGQDWNARYKLLIINRSDTPLRSNVCRDARLVRPLQCFGIFAFNSPCTDARFVRPYIAIMGVLRATAIRRACPMP